MVSFNLRYGTAADGPFVWANREAGVRDLLLSLHADVFCFQEALEFQVRLIADWLPDFEQFGVGRDDGATLGEYAPIYVRRDQFTQGPESGTFWLSETPDVVGSRGWDASLPRICTWVALPGLTRPGFTIANVHLDHQSAKARSHGIAAALLRISGPALLCGDFNAEPGDPLFQSVEAAGFQDLAIGTGDTYNGFGHGPFTRIDYVFGRGFVGAGASVIRGPLVSDHWPVVVDVMAEDGQL